MTRKYSLVIEGDLVRCVVAAILRQGEDEGMGRTDLRGHAGNRWWLLRRVPHPRDFYQCDTWDELRSNVREAVRAYFFAYFIDGSIPERVRLHLVRDEVFAPL